MSQNIALGPSEDYLDRARARMGEIDSLPKDVRALVHEEGWTIVKAFLDCGVRKAKHIRHLIDRSREGSAMYGNGVRGNITGTIAEMVRRACPDMTVAPLEPTREMIEASMAAVSPYGSDPDQPWLSKYNKHKARLRAALAKSPAPAART